MLARFVGIEREVTLLSALGHLERAEQWQRTPDAGNRKHSLLDRTFGNGHRSLDPSPGLSEAWTIYALGVWPDPRRQPQQATLLQREVGRVGRRRITSFGRVGECVCGELQRLTGPQEVAIARHPPLHVDDRLNATRAGNQEIDLPHELRVAPRNIDGLFDGEHMKSCGAEKPTELDNGTYELASKLAALETHSRAKEDRPFAHDELVEFTRGATLELRAVEVEGSLRVELLDESMSECSVEQEEWRQSVSARSDPSSAP